MSIMLIRHKLRVEEYYEQHRCATFGATILELIDAMDSRHLEFGLQYTKQCHPGDPSSDISRLSVSTIDHISHDAGPARNVHNPIA